jgi:hypothetical protein
MVNNLIAYFIWRNFCPSNEHLDLFEKQEGFFWKEISVLSYLSAGQVSVSQSVIRGPFVFFL